MIGLSTVGFFHNDFGVLPQISNYLYENIFRMYPIETEDKTENFLFYNILNNIHIPTPLAAGSFYTITLTKSVPWTIISYDEYETVNLWWLIVLANNITNPVLFPAAGSKLNIIKPRFIPQLLDEITQQLKK